MYENSTKVLAFDFQALVISSCSAEHQEVEKDLVLLLKSQRQRIGLKNYIYGVAKNAFIPPVVEKCFDHYEMAKNTERRFAIPLKFGDIIQFNESDVNHATGIIYRFHREKPIYETSSNNNGQLLKLGGVIEPNKPTTFWTPMETVSIPTEEAKRAEPNVWLQAWIKVETTMRTCQDPFNLELTFDSWANFDPSEQGRVCEAPWHRNSLESKFSIWSAEPKPCEDDDLIECEPREGVFVEENKWAEKIKKQLGLYVGERLFVCKELPQYDFIMPLLKPVSSIHSADSTRTMVYSTIGEYYHFSAQWSSHHQAFLITELLAFPVLRGHASTASGTLMVRVTSAQTNGLFTDQDGTLGLIDDPDHKLALFEFHPACYDNFTAMVEVRAVRAIENRSVRYRILRVLGDDDNISRYESWLKDNEFPVGPLMGVVINNDTVLCPRYPNVFFRLPINQRHPVGSGVRVIGRRMKDMDNEVLITEATIDPARSIVRLVDNGESRIFQTELRPVENQLQLAQSTHFGPVDMRNMDFPANKEKFPAWVRESPQFRDCRRACTTMEVFSLAQNTPLIPLSTASVLSTSRQSARSTPNGSSQGSSSRGSNRSSAYSIVNNRFTGAALRKSSQSSQSTKEQSKNGSENRSDFPSERHGSDRGDHMGSTKSFGRQSTRSGSYLPPQGSDHYSSGSVSNRSFGRQNSDRGSDFGFDRLTLNERSGSESSRNGSTSSRHYYDRGSSSQGSRPA